MAGNQKKQANGEGSVYQRKDGLYGAAVSLGKDAAGKRLRHVVTGKTEQEAIDKMRLWLALKGYIEQTVINGMSSIEVFVEDYKVNGLRERNNEDVTIDNYCNLINIFQNFFSGKRLGQIDADEINRFFVWLINDKTNGQYHYGAVTINRLKGLLNRMFRRAVRKGYLQTNPVDAEELKNFKAKKEKVPVKALTDEEMEIILKKLSKNEIVFPVVALMSITGMRTQEALGLQWGDVDFVNGSIHIQRAITKRIERDEHGNKVSAQTVLGSTKTGASKRNIEVPKEVLNLLLMWKKTAPLISQTRLGKTDFIFGNSKSPSWTYGGFRSSVKRALALPLKAEEKKLSEKEAKIAREFHLHRLRHTVATKLSNQPGVTVFNIMQLLGHTEIKTAQKYIDNATKERSQKNREFMERISVENGLFRPEKGMAPNLAPKGEAE